MDQQIEISFENSLPADAARFAADLAQDLREADASTDVTLAKARADSQDFGTTLVLVFGTPVAIALAKAVSTFLQRNSGASIKITKYGEVIAHNLDSQDAAKIAAAFSSKRVP